MIWPKSNLEIANFFGVTVNNIRSHQRNHSKELVEGVDFFRKNLGVSYAPTPMTVWSKEGAIKLAHYCTRSAKARAFLEQSGIQKLHTNHIEGEIIETIIDSLDGLMTCYKQYTVEGYRIDLYLKDINLAIECDERGHEYRNETFENIRQRTIESKLGCEFLRFNPDECGFRLGTIINEIFTKYLSKKRYRAG